MMYVHVCVCVIAEMHNATLLQICTPLAALTFLSMEYCVYRNRCLSVTSCTKLLRMYLSAAGGSIFDKKLAGCTCRWQNTGSKGICMHTHTVGAQVHAALLHETKLIG